MIFWIFLLVARAQVLGHFDLLKPTLHSAVVYSNDYNLKIFWNVTDNNIIFGLELAGAPSFDMTYSWIGIGLGKGMLRGSQFIVCHQTIPSIVIHEHAAVQQYSAPEYETVKYAMAPILGSSNSSLMSCLFNRSAVVGDGHHIDIVCLNSSIFFSAKPFTVSRYHIS